MSYVVPHYKHNGEIFVSEHFRHIVDQDGTCCPESPEHFELKVITVSKLKQEYPEFKRAKVEKKPCDIPIGDKCADGCLWFDGTDPYLGKGIAVEAQVHNEGKDIEETTQNYREEGFSTVWVYQEDKDGRDVELPEPEPVFPPYKEGLPLDYGCEGSLSKVESAVEEASDHSPKRRVEAIFPSAWDWERYTLRGQAPLSAFCGSTGEGRLPNKPARYEPWPEEYLQETVVRRSIQTTVKLPSEYYRDLAAGRYQSDRPCMEGKDRCKGPDQTGFKCFSCSGVKSGKIDYWHPEKKKPGCEDNRHWCSGPHGTRAVCETCAKRLDMPPARDDEGVEA
jgi:hypothetical protein